MQAGPSEPGISQQHDRLQMALLAPVPARPKSNKEYFAEWDAWARQPGQNPGAKSKEAVKRMKAWLKAGRPGKLLNLSSLRLTSLPPLPASLQKLDVSCNQLSSVPALQALTALQELNVSGNPITELPHLPSSLRRLHAAYNPLTSLPLLPALLQELDVSWNQLSSLPEFLGTIVRNGHRIGNHPLKSINLKGNAIPEEQIQRLHELIGPYPVNNSVITPPPVGQSDESGSPALDVNKGQILINRFERTMIMQNQKAFSPFALQHGLLANMQEDQFPTRLWAWSHQVLELTRGATHFGFVFSGEAVLNCLAGSFTLNPGMYFSVSGSATVSGRSEGIVISRLGYDGFFQLGGPVEATGRLNYIDGCTDSLLIAPIMRGDPCLNLLHFPPEINQASHTHPSMHVGIVVSGEGICRTRDDSIPLRPGQVFIIHAHQEHAFATQGQSMRVIVYHPDSDFGATHQDHPMINRTIVDGVSAAELPHLQTR